LNVGIAAKQDIEKQAVHYYTAFAVAKKVIQKIYATITSWL